MKKEVIKKNAKTVGQIIGGLLGALFLVWIVAGLAEASKPYVGFEKPGGAPIAFAPSENQTDWGRDSLPAGWYVLESTHINSNDWVLLGPQTNETLLAHPDRSKPWADCNGCVIHRWVWFPGGEWGGYE